MANALITTFALIFHPKVFFFSIKYVLINIYVHIASRKVNSIKIIILCEGSLSHFFPAGLIVIGSPVLSSGMG